MRTPNNPRKKTGRRKTPLTITVDPKMLDWIGEQIALGEFASYSHAVSKGLIKLRKEMEK